MNIPTTTPKRTKLSPFFPRQLHHFAVPLWCSGRFGSSVAVDTRVYNLSCSPKCVNFGFSMCQSDPSELMGSMQNT